MKAKAAIIGSGHIGTDLLVKILRTSDHLEALVVVGIDAASDGLALARRLGVATVDTGIHGLLELPQMDDIAVIFDATSASAHRVTLDALQGRDLRIIDLTPAAVGPFVVPTVNLDAHADARVVNMVTCGGQATIPIVAAVSQVAPVEYAEIVASIASKSAGPGTRANIDEFTQTTARAIEAVGGAKRGKAIIVLNPAEPPLIMRDTVTCLCADADPEAIRTSVHNMVKRVQDYVPGYRLKQEVQIEAVSAGLWPNAPAGLRVTVFLEIEGAGHHLPTYAGNLDIMTSAAMRTAENMVRTKQ